jgi:hypothetical protein
VAARISAGIGRPWCSHGATSLLHEEDKASFAKRPFDFSSFSSYFKTTLILQGLVIHPCLENSRKYPVAFLGYIRRSKMFLL